MAFATINSSAPTSIPAIENAFAAEPGLKKRVYDAIAHTPQHAPLFEDIAKYTSSLLDRTANSSAQTVELVSDGPAMKKRKLQNGDAPANAQSPGDLKADMPLQFYMQDVSFAMPQRKKLTLEITAQHGFLRARNQTSKEVEFGVPLGKIQHVLCLPVPEKNQRQFNFCIIPQYGDGVNPPPEGVSAPEAMVWTVADGPPKAAFSGTGQQLGTGDGETADKVVQRVLNDNLSQTKVVRPDERQFVSAMPEAHRKGEKAYHVKAFRGSKEGYLFLLSTGILFGFKKPLVFFAFENVDSISYTSVLQRTFNLNVVARSTGSDETQEFEFSMIDQADFSGIDTYIKKHGLQDASLAEARRAKRYNVNNVKTEDDATEGGAEEEESELQKAQRELEDQEDEDEDEEDYDPGSESDTDGSGSSSDEDDDEDQEGGMEDDEEEDEEGDDRDIVAEELGSEAEDVPADES
ncbi:putative negative regulator of DNA transposition [Aspergillus heteromorphus CBS 117.55]|uniref:Putative negative regulator of DNA transposition n=1 Tax=Aspergillus heteromorphus CBS 117.55 TaxID=1448321 RepID=A0A317VWB9_9EURO|nr:putative negative regulator of DNA transposition [Aspergillus heteromorphus CBS 117.55]PWY76220.1 putative negative regulator of DNA transposition [Aspergillus heteromorphus CBS 117.55]